MRFTPGGTGGTKKESGYSTSSDTQNMQNSNGTSNQGPAGALANYTLPGVISYLTSEFTSLERYKIMTNLEKSEMKYRIQQLTSELNSLRFINEKQALRIKFLEEKLENSAAVEPAEKSELLKKSPGVNSTLDPKQEITKNGEKSTINGQRAESLPDTKIPHVNLEYLRNSRQKLNHSIREIVSLLEPPSGLDFLEAHAGPASETGLEDLLENSRPFAFESVNTGHERNRETTIFDRYTLSKDDLPSGPKISFGTESKSVETPEPESRVSDQTQAVENRHENTSVSEESDTETVIIDEPSLVGILANGNEKK